ncbi:cytochrome b/b6 domain-containing protein [Neogemmobacter tilapiae]|uniref:Cytochrome b561 n=1 Tax=Neogemmobacter tilapiae TaxID=875041 RepID=A0A918WHA2_9RHOB|nr:cytochrome b/b6 domain-containing protein [Gemmobacter tilapiae]GHC46438.1 cytochrome b561 [Gemmobacter tilapiae]
MPTQNTTQSYGSVARTFHWLTALLILSAIGLGLYAESLPYDTGEALAAKAQVFSLHKTVGIAAFFVALARILWAFTQPRPTTLHPDRKLETLAAEFVHWSLYAAMLIVPLSGWITHAATTGFAPIYWPLGQDLPLVPKSESVEHAAGFAHWLFGKVLIVSLILHVAGAIKHVVIDRDATLSRMVTGRSAGPEHPAHHHRAPMFAALALYAAGTAAALSMTGEAPAPQAEQAAAPAATTGNWQVAEGTLDFSIRQMGSDVTGNFANWQAEIRFDDAATTESRGKVVVTIDTTSLTLGSVSDQAKGPEFFDVATHPKAIFTADLLAQADGTYLAKGELDLHGIKAPLDLPFALTIDGDKAMMTATTTLDRRDYQMGAAYPDESSVGFVATVTVNLTANRVK